jgi:hypothetical protein
MKYLNPSFSVGMPCHVSDEDWAAAFSGEDHAETDQEPTPSDPEAPEAGPAGR